MKLFLVLSVILHALMLSVIIENKVEEVQPKSSPAPIKLMSESENADKERNFIPSSVGDEPCEDYYYGLGFKYDFFNNVTDLSPNSPAEKNGLEVGDLLMNNDEIGGWERDSKESVGKVIRVEVQRNDKLITLTIPVGKICTEESNEEE